ncbi:MAG: uroporphyrinogen decarboxylase family protein [Candidatus Hydrogenedentales bacterium]
MSMSSYEVVRRAIEFDRPDRLPLRFEKLGLSDVRSVCWNQIGPGNKSEKHSIDEWGCGWERSDVQNMGQVKEHPLQDWSALDSFSFPDPDTPAFYEGMEHFFETDEDLYRCTDIFMLLFERMHALRGFENTLVDLYAEPERIGWLADRIIDFDLGIIRNIYERFGNKIHGFGFTDDWGTERDLFISPELWVEFFKPRYQRIFDACHANGWHVWMHSCGKVNGIIEDLIDIGLNVINLQQPRALGIEEIGERFRGRICFESLCDIQHTLPFKGPAEICEEAQLLLHHWGTPDGGFILSDYGDAQAIGVALDTKEIMLGAFRDADPWRRAWPAG